MDLLEAKSAKPQDTIFPEMATYFHIELKYFIKFLYLIDLNFFSFWNLYISIVNLFIFSL